MILLHYCYAKSNIFLSLYCRFYYLCAVITNLNTYFTMNLRVFKKDIEFFIGEFIEDCELFLILNPHKDAEKIDAIVEEAVDLYNDIKLKAAHAEGNKKAYYNGLTKAMFEKLDELSEKLSTVVAEA